MPTDKLNKLQSEHTDSSAKYTHEERGTATKGINLDNLLPPDHARGSLDETEYDDHRSGRASSSAPQGEEQVTAEIKTKVENTLSRLKSESGMSESSSSTDSDSTDSGSTESGTDSGNTDSGTDSERDEADSPRYGETKGSTSSESRDTAPGLSIKSIKAELEKRRTELLAMVHTAEARAREAEEKFQQTEARLEEESEKRQLAEKQVHELMGEYQQQLSSIAVEESKRREAERAHEESQARLKEAEHWIKEAEATFNTETEARRLAEEALTESEEKAEEASRSLAEVERKWAEAEARARAAEENAREIEAMIGEVEAVGQETTERLKATEARAHEESELRALAEKRLKALEEDLSSYLEVDWLKDEADTMAANVTRANVYHQESNLEYQEQIEAERSARISAERALAVAEAKVSEAEAEIRRTDEKHRQSEAGLKKIVRKQEAELRTLSEQVFRTKEPTVEMTSTRYDEEVTQIVPQSLSKDARIKLVAYGAVIMLLLVMLYHLIAAIIQRM
jgi:tetrahydromethanopterin S-methyltransferase subunit G